MTSYMPKVGSMGLDMMYRTCTVQVGWALLGIDGHDAPHVHGAGGLGSAWISSSY